MTQDPLLVLVGPAAAGKSALGALIAQRCGVRFIDLDEVAGPFYAEVGWSVDRLVARIADVGRVAAEREWEPARAHAVRRVVAESDGAVIALGAGHTSFTRRDCAADVAAVLARVSRVVLLLPYEDRARSLDELRRRSLVGKGTDWIADGHDFLAEWLDDQGTRAVATAVFLTEAESPAQTADRIVAWLHRE